MSGPASWRPDGVPLGGIASAGAAPRVPPAVATAALDHDLGPEDLFLATEVASLAPPEAAIEREAALLLTLAVLAAAREGSTRVAVGPASLVPILRRLGGTAAAVDRATALAGTSGPGCEWLGPPGAYRPLISDGSHLATQRLRFLEARLADHLLDRIGLSTRPDGPPPEEILASIRERPPRLATGVPVVLSEEQERAVRSVLERPLALVTGGPGTGKTSVVVSILRAWARRAAWDERAVALAAPTGRAADRLRVSLLRFLRAVEQPSPEDLQLLERPPDASTLHRLLGYSPRAGRFRHHEHHPLEAELVVVDESSMVDLELMDRLLRSVRPQAHLVFLGDADQLPSVGAGAVFRDLSRVPALAARGAAVRLTHSYRMDVEDPAGRAILRAANRVRGGEALRPGTDFLEHEEPATVRFEGMELLRGGARRRVGWWERWAGTLREPGRAADHVFRRERGGAWRSDDRERLESLLSALEGARILTAHRGWAGGTGAAAINRWFHERHAREHGLGPPGTDPLPGEPILATRNDHRQGLFNGDQGVVVRVGHGSGRTSDHAVFRVRGELAAFPVGSLRGTVELAWATTVHKAQGSEMDRVTLALPDQPTRILDRELVYTAVTRARRSVVLLGSPEILAAAIARTPERSTALGDILGAAAGTDPPTPPEAPSGPPDPGRQLSLWD